MQCFIAVLFTLAAITGASAGQGVGKTFFTRDPLTCSSKKEPANGSITPALAKRYLACSAEGVQSGYLYLLEDVSLDVGKGTPFRELGRDSRPSDGDPDGKVYPIRGSLKRYQCREPSKIMDDAGKNCTIYEEPKATGICYRTTFGDWSCNMGDLNTSKLYRQPPPANLK